MVPDVREDGFPEVAAAGPDEAIDALEAALQSLVRLLKQTRLHGYIYDRAHVDVDQASVALLYVLAIEEHSLRLTEIAERLRIEAPAVSRKAQQLERSGLVSRSQDPRDGRASRLELTAAGHGVVDRILAARRDWLLTVLDDWPTDERAEFARLLGRFTADVRHHVEGLDVREH
jgi:DNA-binding MarR family transcriptional regulator